MTFSYTKYVCGFCEAEFGSAIEAEAHEKKCEDSHSKRLNYIKVTEVYLDRGAFGGTFFSPPLFLPTCFEGKRVQVVVTEIID
jgi:DNA-directed RNA polymerase subunit RPC12/RpoP